MSDLTKPPLVGPVSLTSSTICNDVSWQLAHIVLLPTFPQNFKTVNRFTRNGWKKNLHSFWRLIFIIWEMDGAEPSSPNSHKHSLAEHNLLQLHRVLHQWLQFPISNPPFPCPVRFTYLSPRLLCQIQLNPSKISTLRPRFQWKSSSITFLHYHYLEDCSFLPSLEFGTP